MMKPLRMILRNTRDAIKSVFRNLSLSIASISCITITLILVAISIAGSYNVRNIEQIMKNGLTIVVFLDGNITDAQIQTTKNSINNMDNVREVTLRSKQDAADSLKNGDSTYSDVYKEIMKDWSDEDNPLRDTFIVQVNQAEKIKGTAEKIKKLENVSIVQYGEKIVDQLLSTFNVIEKALIIVVISLVLVATFLIANTIKITIFARRKEIEIMRLVGASNINIVIPFIVEGFFLGILGSIIPVILVIYGYSALYSHYGGQLIIPTISLVSPEPFIFILSLFIIGLGILVGMVGSLRATRKHLKI